MMMRVEAVGSSGGCDEGFDLRVLFRFDLFDLQIGNVLNEGRVLEEVSVGISDRLHRLML